jgi:hypothetical protein
MALGGLIWGSAATIAGATFAMLGPAVLFLASLLLFSRVSINLARNLEEAVSGFLSGNAELEQIPPIALTNESLQPE